MKKLFVLVAVFALVLGARVTGSQAFTMLPASLYSDTDMLYFKFTGTTNYGDTTFQPDDDIFDGHFASWRYGIGDEVEHFSDNDFPGYSFLYAEPWGTMYISSQYEADIDRWVATAGEDGIYTFSHGLYDKSVYVENNRPSTAAIDNLTALNIIGELTALRGLKGTGNGLVQLSKISGSTIRIESDIFDYDYRPHGSEYTFVPQLLQTKLHTKGLTTLQRKMIIDVNESTKRGANSTVTKGVSNDHLGLISDMSWSVMIMNLKKEIKKEDNFTAKKGGRNDDFQVDIDLSWRQMIEEVVRDIMKETTTVTFDRYTLSGDKQHWLPKESNSFQSQGFSGDPDKVIKIPWIFQTKNIKYTAICGIVIIWIIYKIVIRVFVANVS